MARDELITYRDDATGERVGLTAADVAEWTAATASLLTEECALGPGSQVAVLLPPHWQTAAVLLGAWSAGIEVSFRGWATAGLSPAGPALDASFVAYARIRSWLDEVPSARHQFALFSPGASTGWAATGHAGARAGDVRLGRDRPPGAQGGDVRLAHDRPRAQSGDVRLAYGQPPRAQRADVPLEHDWSPRARGDVHLSPDRPPRVPAGDMHLARGGSAAGHWREPHPDFSDIPDGYRDFLSAVQPHFGAGRPGFAAGPGHAASTDGTTFGEYGALAAEIAAINGIAAGDRVLVDVSTTEQPLTWLLAPLSAGASVVLGDNLDPVRRDALLASEKITRVLG